MRVFSEMYLVETNREAEIQVYIWRRSSFQIHWLHVWLNMANMTVQCELSLFSVADIDSNIRMLLNDVAIFQYSRFPSITLLL